MDTRISTPKTLFEQARCYVIPPFQRPYVWDEERQWEPLWNDIRNTAETYLENYMESSDRRRAEHQTPPHFLGAIVIQQEQTSSSEIGQWVIVDGQQRVTTLQLLIDAARSVCVDLQLDPVHRLTMLVKNDDRIYSGHETIKLWPTRIDMGAFQAVMDGTSADTDMSSKLVEAHHFFKGVIADWIQSEDDYLGRALALEAAITSRLQLVVIDLDIASDPHAIFETLNARGTPLLASDLVRNYSLSEAQDGTDRINMIWDELRDEWWQSDIQQGRLRRARIEVALNYWLVMRKAKEVLASNMFAEFKGYADRTNIETVMHDVQFVLSKYRAFQSETSFLPEEIAFRYKLDTMQMGVVTPIILLLLASPTISEEKRIKSFRAMESFLIRRMVCRGTTKNYNRQVQSLLLDFQKHGTADSDKVIAEFLRRQDADAGEWPGDAQIRFALLTSGVYRLLTRGRLRLVLEAIEAELRSSMSEQIDVPKGLTIEHVMPQDWQKNWPLPEENTDVEDPASKRNSLIDTLGNLTLVTGRLNSSLSNAPWAQKRGTLQSHSNMSLNSELLSALQGTTWNEEAILDRSKRLTDAFIRVWPGPDSPEWD